VTLTDARDWVERTTTSLANGFDVIRAENLNVVTRSARGTVDSPEGAAHRKPGSTGRAQVAPEAAPDPAGTDKPSAGSKTANTADRRRPVNAGTHLAAQSRQSHATFVCVSCGHPGNGEVNGP
jgi:putative transposase